MNVERPSVDLDYVGNGDTISATVNLDEVQTPGGIDEENEL
jgi:hypothetical protein